MKPFHSSLRLMIVVGIVSCPGSARGQVPYPSNPTVTVPLPISEAPPVGSVTTTQATTPGASGGNTLTGSIQIQGGLQGSVPTGLATPEPLPLNLAEAVRRGLAYNLGVIGATEVERDARALQREALARLLPDLNGTITAAVEDRKSVV